MKKFVYSMMLSSAVVVGASAHEVWLELDSKKNEAQLFFGHFDIKEKESGEKFAKIKEGVAYPKDLLKDVKRNDNNVTYTFSKATDVVVVREDAPRKSRAEGITTKRISYSKAGITSKDAITKFDIVPVDASKNIFKIVFDNKPLAKTKVTAISPTGWTKTFSSDEKGEFTVETPWKGGYLLQTSFEDETKGEEDGVAFDKTVHALSLNITITQGLPWEVKK
ncbi:DUF4198 domain-containing protein [Aliarcobacter vitoriensis]|uniref:DUF4198 domain-containing protein n=1 Tax=Aliarcobacter vitoriensis TaxID=2011099 RepID=A0A366MUE0_9BACT|nr:DUF4198 domain-containing protein [Aliarcobacter vitoriensis]RBQ29677.1 hypothetical protein CRU91_03510 [Aliarcobacter vitoriensis]RBQ30602.1 hypothetical protein CRU92_11295 [Arcobacter sp. FW59]